MQSRSKDLATGEIAQRTWDDYRDNCDLILRVYDPDVVVESMGPEHLQELRAKLFEGVNPTTAGNRIRMAKTAIRFVETIVPKFRMDFGKWFRQPSAKVKRKARIDGGKKLHTAQQIRDAVDQSNPAMKAMILLGINCAFGNSDCSRLQWEHLDLSGGWHDYHREKTYIERRAKLWPETIQAIKSFSGGVAGRVFHTKYGNAWSSTSISHEAFKLGIEFYRLRKTFRTVADSTKEVMAIHLIMGHASSSTNMDHVYVQEVVDKRLEFVSEYVRAWYLNSVSTG
jgi:integrase